MDRDAFFGRGWVKFPAEPATLRWAEAAAPAALATLDDPDLRAAWLRCNGTWFAGVNALANDRDGAIAGAGVPPLSGAAVDFVAKELGLAGFAWDRAQISICFPGYPAQGGEESDAAFRYRRDRDAAHIDGLQRDAARRRKPNESHGFILGLALNLAGAGAAPFVVYEGSHQIMRRALTDRLAGIAPEKWRDQDVTDAYIAARREAFETCPRVEIPARPGEAYLAHRLCLHGVAPWASNAPGDMRMIAYFRPDPYPGEPPDWWLTRE